MVTFLSGSREGMFFRLRLCADDCVDKYSWEEEGETVLMGKFRVPVGTGENVTMEEVVVKGSVIGRIVQHIREKGRPRNRRELTLLVTRFKGNGEVQMA